MKTRQINAFARWTAGLLALLAVLHPAFGADPALPAEPVITIQAPASGASFTAPGPVVFEATAVDPKGDIRRLDFFVGERLLGTSEFLAKIAVIPGNPIPHRFEWKEVPAGTHQVTAVGKATDGRMVRSKAVMIVVRPASVPSGVVLLPAGSEWRYLYDGTVPAENWRADGFDGSKWKSGPAQLGFGDGDERTVIRTGAAPHPVTAYFRTEFKVPENVRFSRLLLRLLRDDGAVVHLNGVEIARSNLPDGRIQNSTLALDQAANENAYVEISVAATALKSPVNIIAVEVHQAAVTSSDLGFDLEIVGLPADATPIPTVGIEATRPATSEPSPLIRVAPGLFTLRRTGSTLLPQTVRLKYGGTATAGVDYAKLPELAVIPAGKSELALEVIAQDDERVEGTESVVAELVASDPLAFLNYAVDPKAGRAEITIADTDQPTRPTLTMDAPTPGSTFALGATITLKATAIDPAGYLPRVEFYDGNTRIGVSEITFIRAPDPGTPIHHSFDWKGASAGEHRIRAQAILDGDGVLSSESVPLVVKEGGVPQRIVVEIETVDGTALEPASAAISAVDPGILVVRRVSGPLDVELHVFYTLDGDAVHGIDFAKLPESIVLAKGAEKAEVIIRALPDTLREGDEKVVLRLVPTPCITIFPPPLECYGVGPRETGSVVIRDATTSGNQAPRVALVAPRNGTVFSLGDPITVAAEASDPDGTLARLDIFAGDKLLGSTKESRLAVDWKEATVGVHKLSARALDDAGKESTSAIVTISVRDPIDLAWVRRVLPPAYLPGGPIEVVLAAEPARTTKAWTLEDRIPAGWTFVSASDDGGFDAVNGKVKFGPFTDNQARRLSYRITAPSGATGPQKFAGTSSADGKSVPVAGNDQVLPAGENHPADAKPSDKAVRADELTAYAGAWKAGQTWGEPPTSIPLSYVTRAAQIWKQGETYVFDPAQGAPPECWVPATPKPGSAAALAGTVQPDAAAERHAAAARPGRPEQVRIQITPPAGTIATAVEEIVPEGWQVAAITEGGTFDAASRRIRWGIYWGAAQLELGYSVTPPSGTAANARFQGWASFDGRDVPLGGTRVVGSSDESTALRIRQTRREGRGRIQFDVSAAPDQVFAVEASSDLRTWTELGSCIHTGEAVSLDDTEAAASEGPRYYRLKPIVR